MSLVNDMLRDLNKRTPVSNKAARVHGTINSSIENKRPSIRVGLILAGGLLAGLGGGYLYFESMGVQVVQVPLAVVPAQTGTSPGPGATVGQQVATQTVGQASTAGTEPVASANVVEIQELSVQPNGFTVLIKAAAETAFEVRDRSTTGLTLHLDGIDDFSRANSTIPGISVLLVSDGLDIGLELDDPADFLVREDTETGEFDILLTASFRPGSDPLVDIPAEQLVNADTAATANVGSEQAAPPAFAAENLDAVPAQELSGLASDPVQESSSAVPQSTAEQRSSVRVSRGLSLEEQDRNSSQAAVMMMQGGRIDDAYQHLRTFLEENPAAHQSRETLATLLFAQRQYSEAGAVVDAGLNLVPNYAPFKKIKARLLMQDNDPVQALALLRNLPPPPATDTEYHELLASLYRQGNFHEQAVSVYQDLLRVDSQQGGWWAGLGISLEAQDRGSDAMASYQAALQTSNLDNSLKQYVQNRIAILGRPQ